MEPKCILCNGETYSIIDEKLNRTFHRCIDCDLLFRDETQILSEESEVSRYSLHNNTIEEPGY